MTPTPTVRNITRCFRLTTADDRIAGLSWYESARRVAAELDPANPARAAAVIAVLSPRVSWRRNCQLALDAYSGRPIGTLKLNASKAHRILAGEDPEDVVSGAKVRAFFHCIAHPDDPRAVVIDRHACDIALGRVSDDATRGRILGRVGGYDHLCDLYRRAARIITRETGRHWTPAQLQAACWLVHRRTRALAYHGD